MSRISEKAEETLSYVYDKIDSLDVDSLKSDGLTIRAGNKVLKFLLESESELQIEDEIRAELRDKLADRLSLIKTEVAKKITEMSEVTERYKREYEKKETELRRRIDRTKMMPDVFYEHARRGLSVVQGGRKDELIWLVQGIYWPKFYDMKPIETKFSKRMLTNVTFMVETERNRINKVSTRKTLGLDYFDHYHQSQPDCWGQWKYVGRKWETPEDIIAVAKEAEAVLENINSRSIANHNPRGLPRDNTIQRHIVKDSEKIDLSKQINQMATRTGIGRDIIDGGDVWTT